VQRVDETPTARPGAVAKPALSAEERIARLDRVVAGATREFAAIMRSRTEFEAVLIRGEPVRHLLHLLRLAVLVGLSVAAALAFTASGSLLTGLLLVPVGYAVFWLYLTLTGGEQLEWISIDEEGRISTVSSGHGANLRADVLKVVIPSVVIIASGWVTFGLIHGIIFPPQPDCMFPAVRDNQFCRYVGGFGGGTALTVGQVKTVERAVRALQLLYSGFFLIGSIWFLRHMLTGRSVVDVRPVRRRAKDE
jgi:hypothetical protein